MGAKRSCLFRERHIRFRGCHNGNERHKETFKSTGEAALSLCRYGEAEKPREILGLKKRFELFLKLYETNKENFIDFGRLV